MGKHTLTLNSAIKENYSFFCPDSGFHLDLLRPSNSIELDVLTPAIKRGINAKTLIYISGDAIFENCASCGYLEVGVKDVVDPPEIQEVEPTILPANINEPDKAEVIESKSKTKTKKK